MTELEALKVLLDFAITSFAQMSKQLEAEVGLPDEELVATAKSLDEATDVLSALIENVEKAEADPELAVEDASRVMAENGVYVTATFGRAWFDEIVGETAVRPLTAVETETLLAHCIMNAVENATAETLGAIHDWLSDNVTKEAA